jgi:amidohydrolase
MRIHVVVLVALLIAAPLHAQTTGEIDVYYPDLQALYQDIHRNPELAFQEVQTAAKLAARLKALGYEVTTGVGRTGIVGLLKNGTGPTVMLRTELDALPVAEKTGAPFASTVVTKNLAGVTVPVMHACGHDLHMTAWSGTAKWMAEHRSQWRGTLMLVGQPAEESNGGAAAMLKDGLFQRFPKPDYVIGLHDDDTMPAGTIGFHPGPFRAMSISPTVTLYGRGGHGAMPYNTIDPVVMAARTVMALQTVVSRENNPMDPVVLTIGSIHGGTQANVIPDEVKLELNIRTYTDEVQKRVLAAVARIVKAEAAAAGAPREPSITMPESGHVVVNDPALTRRIAAALQKAIGTQQVIEMPAKMTSEDFAEYGRAGVPSVLLHIGAVNPAKLAESRRTGIPVPAPHSPEWLPDLEPTLKAAIRGETVALLDLFNGR